MGNEWSVKGRLKRNNQSHTPICLRHSIQFTIRPFVLLQIVPFKNSFCSRMQKSSSVGSFSCTQMSYEGDDDGSRSSKMSGAAFDDLLVEDFDMTIDIEIPLEDLPSIDEDADGVFETRNKASTSWATTFSEQHERQLMASVSHDSSQDKEKEGALDEDDISSLMTADLIEPTDLRENDAVKEEGATVIVDNKCHSRRQAEMSAPMDSINSIMGYIYYNEPHRQLFHEADKIVRDCHDQYQLGKSKYRNLPGAIFERLVLLFGAERFKEIYHASQTFVFPPHYDPQQEHHRVAAAHVGNDDSSISVQLAIAYGIHIARVEQADHDEGQSEPPKKLIQHGLDTLRAMNQKERRMFWDYMTQCQ